MVDRMERNILVCGVGGQGNVVLSRTIARAFAGQGYHVTVGETYGSAQRGGSVTSHVRVSGSRECGPLIPHGRADVVVGLEPMETIKGLVEYGNSGVAVIANTRPVYPVSSILAERDYPDIEKMKKAIATLSGRCWLLDATAVGLELKNPVLMNMVVLGALLKTGETGLSLAGIGETLRRTFPEKADMNLEAIRRGMQQV